MKVQTFFDKDTFTLTYLVFDATTKDAIIIDPVYNFDYASGALTTEQFEEISDFLNKNQLKLHYILETHAHADHFTGSQLLKRAFSSSKIAISKKIKIVQETFKPVFNLSGAFPTDGSQFDKLIEDHEEFNAGSLKIKAIPTPGHTPACLSYLINKEAVFTGDALFMPDYGTGRCDFPKGDAKTLYQSITKGLYSLPDTTRVFVGHDYQPNGRELKFESTIGEEKVNNKQLSANVSESDFVNMRMTRDKTLSAPKLLLPSLQVNIVAGRLPEEDSNGKVYLKIPLKTK
jgi:glyoxylase-like metal-dependent hydrolase (beta-lactamase superfamily II)